MAMLSEAEFKATFALPMKRLPLEAEPPFDFWPYFDSIPGNDFAGHECHGDVTYVWEDAVGRFQHVLFNSEDANVFMALVLDVHSQAVMGHRLLDFNELYALDET
jgi:hypothetical protein